MVGGPRNSAGADPGDRLAHRPDPRRIGTTEAWGRFTRLAAVVLLALGVVSVASSIPASTNEPAGVGASQAGGPPIYMILLDAYPRADALASLGFDGEPFLAALEARGFDVARRSTANYDRTAHTLASMLWMEHLVDIDELDPPPADHQARARLLKAMISSGGPAVTELRDRGYRVMTIPSAVGGVTVWDAEVVPVDQISDYEIHLLNDTDGGHLAVVFGGTNWLAAAQRAGTQRQLDTLVDNQGPGRFIFTHVLSPHPPYVFGPEGGVRACFPACPYWAPDAEPGQRLVDQIEVLDGMILETLDRLSPDAVVVLFSDHGHWLDEAPDPFGNLLAVRTPDRTGVIEDDTTLVSVLPRLFNAYFEAGIAIPDDRHFDGGPLGARLELTEVSVRP